MGRSDRSRQVTVFDRDAHYVQARLEATGSIANAETATDWRLLARTRSQMVMGARDPRLSDV